MRAESGLTNFEVEFTRPFNTSEVGLNDDILLKNGTQPVVWFLGNLTDSRVSIDDVLNGTSILNLTLPAIMQQE